MTSMTLTLDAEYRPMGLIPLRQAAARVARELYDGADNCEVLLSDPDRVLNTPSIAIPAPLIIRWRDYVELDRDERVRVSKRVLFARDNYTCQYCGFVATPGSARKYLTVDHVKPAHLYPSRAIATTWDNVTTACGPCNSIKGGHLPIECGMMPAKTPMEPHFVQIRFGGRGMTEAQRNYVREFYALEEDDFVI